MKTRLLRKLRKESLRDYKVVKTLDGYCVMFRERKEDDWFYEWKILTRPLEYKDVIIHECRDIRYAYIMKEVERLRMQYTRIKEADLWYF